MQDQPTQRDLQRLTPAELLSRLEHTSTDHERLPLLNALSWLFAASDLARAEAFNTEVQQLAERLPFPVYEAHALLNHARCQFYRGQYVHALITLDQAERAYNHAGSPPESGMINLMRAESLYRLADYHKAQEAAERAVEKSEADNNERVITSALSIIGAIATNHQNYTLALDCFTRCIPYYEARQFTRGLGKAYNNIGKVYLEMGSYLDALTSGERALHYYKLVDDVRGMTLTYSWYGDAYRGLGDLTSAETYYRSALRSAKELPDYPVWVDMHYKLASLSQQNGNYPAAIAAYHEVLSLAEAYQQTHALREAHIALATCYEYTEDYQSALYHLRQYQALHEASNEAETAEKLRRFQEKSEVRIARQEAEILRLKMVETQRQLEHADRLSAVGRMASGIAHEINNPLQGIYGNLLLLTEETLIPATAQPYVTAALEQIERIILLAAGMREMYQFDIRDQAPLDLSELVRKVLFLAQKTIDSQHIKTRLMLADDLPLLVASPTHIQQVMMNLILNGIEAMPNGGSLTIRTAFHTQDQILILEVHDTGIGITPEQLPHVFEPFYTTRKDGAGLGLAICQNIIKRYNGDITLSSAPGKYTLARVIFQLQTQDL